MKSNRDEKAKTNTTNTYMVAINAGNALSYEEQVEVLEKFTLGPNSTLEAELPGLAARFIELIKQEFLREGYLEERIYCVGETGNITALFIPDMDQDNKVVWVNCYFKETSILGSIHCMEAWTYHSKGENDPVQKKINAGEIRISELPEQDRTELLRITARSHNGFIKSWSIPIQRVGEQLSLGPTIADD